MSLLHPWEPGLCARRASACCPARFDVTISEIVVAPLRFVAAALPL
jgi:hypothetical protein